MTEKTAHLKAEHSRFAYSFLPGTLFVLLLWLIFVLAWVTDANLAWLGVFPHNFFGLIGIFTGPLIHGDLKHVLSNSFPLILLSGFILFTHRRKALSVFTFVYVGSGQLTWFIGRHAYHIGASGVVYGLAGFLLSQGVLRRDRASLAVSLAVLFLYGGLFYGLFPSEERISWEGHIGGVVAGFGAALLYGERVRKETAAGVPGAAQAVKALQEQHLSSTLQPPQHRLPLQYTLATPGTNQKYHYRYQLNNRTGMVEPPTNEAASSSNTPERTGRRYGRKTETAKVN
ncbi:rhomboid family intramembrane serine protease [Botryobacter ruber]|uniref:rhomboid family intramembrane serine protease n=1 Tax=Botryobacter ruber TaxID=2171629 RepID=UPI000E0B9AAE|nr:rhomboid family intramembrane serine protease [Botryobacter ruber]